MKEKIEFDLDLYKTGKYDVVTREGEKVEIRLTNGREKYPIVGYKENDCHFPSCWTAKGRYLIDKKEDEYDIFLVEKEQPEMPITIKGRKLADYIKDEADNFRQILKDNGIDFQPDDIYWENYARQFMALVEEKGTLPSEEQPVEQTEVDEALVWAAIGANDAYRNKTEDGFEYSVTFQTKSGGIEFKTGEGSTPYAAAVELYKKLKGE